MRIFIYGLGLVVLMACSESTSDWTGEQYLGQAKTLFVQGEDNAAVIELKNALQLDPDIAEARWLLGEAYLDTGEVFAAEKELLLARKLGWDANDILPALAQSQLAQRNYQAVLDIGPQELTTLTVSAQADVQASQAFAHLLLGELDKASTLADSALDKVEGLEQAVLVAAMIAVNQGDNKIALASVEQLLKETPNSQQAWWLKGQMQLQKGDLEAARKSFDQAVVHSEGAFTYLVDRALIAIQLEDFEAAQVDADQLMVLADYHPYANYVQGLLEIEREEYREAIKTLTLALPAAEQHPLALYYLSVAHAMEGDQAKAAELVGDYVELMPYDVRGRKLLGILWLHLDKATEVQALLQSVLDGNPRDMGALNIMANAYLMEDQADRALVLYGRIVQLAPGVSASQLKLGLLAGAGDDAASKILNKQSDAPDQVQPDEILEILNYLQQEEYSNAIAAAEAFRLKNLNSLTPYHILGRVYFMAGQPNQAVETFEKALARDPHDPISNLALSQLALSSGDAKGARRYCEQSLDNNPGHLETMMHFARLEGAQGNETARHRMLDKAIAAHPSALVPRIALAHVYAQTGELAKVQEVFAPLDALQRQSPQVLGLSAVAQLAAGEKAQAQAKLEQLVATQSAAPLHYLLLAQLLEEQGEQEGARTYLQSAVELDDDYLPALIALARLAAYEKDEQAFQSYLETLNTLAPQDSKVLGLRATAAANKGDLAAAEKLSSLAFKQDPSTGTLLAMNAYQKRNGHSGAAKQAQYQWLGKYPHDSNVRLNLAEQLQSEGDESAAEKQYKAVLKREPENILALNNLAWLLREDQPAQALVYITTASKVVPNQADVLDTMAVIQHLNGDTKAALVTVERALALVPANPYARYHHAMIQAALGQTAQAKAALKALLGQYGESLPEYEAAQALLQSLSN